MEKTKTTKRAKDGSETKAAKKVTAKAKTQETPLSQKVIEFASAIVQEKHGDETFAVQAAHLMNSLLNATVTVVATCAKMMGKDGDEEAIHMLQNAAKQIEENRSKVAQAKAKRDSGTVATKRAKDGSETKAAKK